MTPLFLSPFLLFTLELMAGKYYLIRFGGSTSVWLTLLLFFTVSLLLGYLYAAITKPKLHILVVVAASIYCIYQVFNSGSLFPATFTSANPMVSIIFNAGINLGLSVIVLSSASSLLPLWSPHPEPYRYYALSNLGSLIGLISYPLMIEPLIPFRFQPILWLILFLINAGLVIAAARNSRLRETTTPLRGSLLPAPIFYSFLSTAYFLVTTTALSQVIGPFPWLWALPMAIYLISFIIAFTYPKVISLTFHLPLAFFFLLITIAIATHHVFLGNFSAYLWLLATQLIVNVIFHTQLYHLRPPKNGLTTYYVAIALGGAIASVVLSLITPVILSQFLELPILIGLCCITFGFMAVQTFKNKTISALFVLITVLGLLGLWYAYTQPPPQFQPGFSITQTKSRNFYGFLNLIEARFNNEVIERRLLSGKTIHGSQRYSLGSEQEPTEYYNRNTALGVIFSQPRHNVGIIGLGVGTIAAYCHPGDRYTFYEIDPDVIALANTQFSYLSGCTKRGGVVSVVEGDGRISLSSEPSHAYNLLIVDAFTDDAIPFHLLTKEALSLYLSHLTDDGIISLHITNKYLNLKPTIVVTASSLNLFANSYNTPDANYLLLSRVPLNIGNKEVSSMYPHIQVWTDDFTNILQTIKW